MFLQKLAPTYEEVANAFAHAKDKVVVAKVDADGAGRPLGQKYGVKGFPSACNQSTSCVALSSIVFVSSPQMVRSSRWRS